MTIANVSLLNTFDEWRLVTNQTVNLLNDIDDNNLAIFKSNTASLLISANVKRLGTVSIDPNLSTSILDKSITNIASANLVNSVADISYTFTNNVSTFANTLNVFTHGVSTNATASFVRTNAVYDITNSIYSFTNTVNSLAYSVDVRSTSAFDKANDAYSIAIQLGSNNANIIANTINAFNTLNTAFGVANAAFNKANTALISNNILTLNSLPSNIAPSENIGFEVARGSSANVFLLWNETTDSWTFTFDGTNYLNIASNTDINTANNYAGVMANSANAYTITVGAASNLHANIVGVRANTWANTIVSSSTTAANNYAGVMANSSNAWTQSIVDTNLVTARAYTNTSTTAANNYAGVMANSANAYAASLAGTGDLSPPFNKANAAYTVANAAFDKANTGATITSGTLTDAATINWDLNTVKIATVTLGGNRTLATPTNLQAGTFLLHVIQDGSGNRTLSFSSAYKWPAGVTPVLTTASGARDIFSFVSDGTNMYGSYLPDVK